jgi:DNA-binding SARP family transcriptional activator
MAVGIGLLGEVTAQVGGQPVDLGPARQRCVLAALAVDVNHVVPADRLVERVWGTEPPRRAQATLSSYVSRLRQVLAGSGTASLVRRSGGYALLVERTAVDLHRFGQLRVRASVAAGNDAEVERLLAAALGLWRGEALTGVDSAWVATERDRMHQERFAVELDLLDCRLRLGQGEQLVAELSRLAAEHPLDERVAGQYVLALYRGRRAADALEHYQRFRTRLVAELGADPGPALRDLHQRVLNSDPSLLAPRRDAHPTAATEQAVTPRQLPAPPTSFVGRHDELARLDAALEGASRTARTMVISAIAGSGGMGKTWLALHWAHRYAERFPDGQLFVDLRGFSPDREPMNPAVAVRGFLDALGVDPGRVPVAPHAQAALFRSLIADKRMLLVLDNAVDTAQVVPLLPGTDSCLVLVTSRNQLSGLISAHGAAHLMLDVLPDAEARALLAARLGRGRVAAEQRAVDELIRLCGGLPLALSVIAARASMRPDVPLSGFAAELRDLGLRALDEDPGAGISTVLSWSHRALTPPQARAFALLGIAPGADIGLPAAANLVDLPPAATRAVLRELEQASLVGRDARGRYRMHDLVRRYAGEAARRDVPEAERDAALRRVVDHYLQTAHTGHRLLDPHGTPVTMDPPVPGCEPLALDGDPAAMEWFQAEHACLLAAQHAAAAIGWWPPVWRLALVLTSFHVRRGHLNDNLRLWQQAQAAADRAADHATRVLVLRNLGWAHAKLTRHDEAMAHLDRAIALAEESGDSFLLAHTHIALAWAWELDDEWQRALEQTLKALDVLRTMEGGYAREAVALNMAGWYSAKLEAYERGREYCEQALALHRRNGDRNGVAATLDSLAYIAHRTGRPAESLAMYQEALGIFRDLEHTYGAVESLEGMGHPLAALGRPEEARAAWQEAVDMYRAQQRPHLAARVEVHLVELERRLQGTT